MTDSIERVAKGDRKISIAIVTYFVANAGNLATKTILPIPESMWGMVSILFGMLILFSFAACIGEVYRRNKKLLLKSYALFAFLYVISIVLATFRGEPINLIISGSAFLTFAWWIPLGVFACSIRDLSVLYNIAIKGSFIISALCFCMFILHPVDTAHEDYNMSFGNAIILPLLFQINEFRKKHNLLLLAFVIIEILIVLIYANRGILLSLIFFIIYQAIFSASRRTRIIVITAMVAIFGVFAIYVSTIAEDLLAFFDQYGFQSRTVTMIAGGSFGYGSGREDIWNNCFNMISEKPIFGWGLGGEFYHLGKLDGVAEINSSFHPHNGLIQCFVNFGVFGGAIACIIMLIPLFRLGRIKDPWRYQLILIFGASRLIPCCVSASGIFILPEIAIYYYLYYHYKTNNKKGMSL